MTLLAKSPARDGSRKGLAAHSADVMDAFEALFGTRDAPSRLAGAWLRFFRLPMEVFGTFHANGLAACGLHDVGKATDSFQGAVTDHRPQVIRHEHMSSLVLSLPQVQVWLDSELDTDLVLSAVAGHHLKASERKQPDYPILGEPWPGESFADIVELYAEHPDLRAIFDQTAERLGLPAPRFDLPPLWSFSGKVGQSIPALVEELRDRFKRVRKRLRRDSDRQWHALLMAVKSAVIAADSAGSGLAREKQAIRDWLTGTFSDTKLLSDATIDTEVVQKRICQIEERKRRTDSDYRFAFQGFQDQAATLPPRALMLAPCGAGKTLAAWRWIQAQLATSPRSRVLFLYPTRATATEGFRDYVSHAPEADASLLTGTARYELEDLFENPEDGRAYLTEERLFALGYWQKRVFSATVDQFLGFMQQVYRGICLLPVLADGIVVFDEVHSFDMGMFDALKKFLDRFDIPVLCMTASLPAPRRRQLEELGLQVFTGEGLEDLDRLARLPRYRVARLPSGDAAEARARTAVAAGKRVLWVVNTVDRCQERTQSLRKLNPICYHSRFTLNDRKKRHAKVISEFQSNEAKGLLAITTQVCEMSLDLDAQVLISEQAPIPSLIQRMGRCNRHAQPDSNQPGEVYFYPPDSSTPYRPDQLEGVTAFLEDIDGTDTSQERLEELLEHYTRHGGSEGDRWAAFIDDGAWACGGAEELRDSPDYTEQAVIDIDEYLRLARLHEPTDGLIVPVPKKLARRDAGLPRHLRMAPADHYDPALGFMKAWR